MWTMTLAVMVGLSSAAAAPKPPANGTYLVDSDVVTATKIEWAGRCGDVPAPSTLPRGTKLEIKGAGDTWRIYRGDSAVFGTDVCRGDNRTLAPVEKTADSGGWLLRCRPKRLARGEESVDIYLRRVSMERIEVQHRDELRYRKGRDLCNVIVERRLRVKPHVEVKDPFAERFAAQAPSPAVEGADGGVATASTEGGPAVDGGAAPAALGPPKFTTEDIEAVLAAQLAADRARREVTDLRIVHQNSMTKDFVMVERTYKLDGNVLDASGKTTMKVGQLDRVFDDVVEAGTHSLEVEFRYSVNDGGTPVTVTVRDTVFFDTKGGESARLKMVAYEKGNFFTSIGDRPKLRFDVNGVPVRR